MVAVDSQLLAAARPEPSWLIHPFAPCSALKARASFGMKLVEMDETGIISVHLLHDGLRNDCGGSVVG